MTHSTVSTIRENSQVVWVKKIILQATSFKERKHFELNAKVKTESMLVFETIPKWVQVYVNCKFPGQFLFCPMLFRGERVDFNFGLMNLNKR